MKAFFLAFLVGLSLIGCGPESRNGEITSDSASSQTGAYPKRLEGTWLSYRNDRITAKGKKDISADHYGLQIWKFEHSGFSTFSASAQKPERSLNYQGGYSLKEDTLLFSDYFKAKNINTISDDYMELEDYKSPTFTHDIVYLKKMEMFGQGSALNRVEAFLTEGPVQLFDGTRKECEQIKKCFFNKRDSSYFALTDCPGMSFFVNKLPWHLSNDFIKNELVLLLSSGEKMVQIKEVGTDTLKGQRYGDENNEVVITRARPLDFKPEQLNGSWMVAKSYQNNPRFSKITFNRSEILTFNSEGVKDIFEFKMEGYPEILRLTGKNTGGRKGDADAMIWVREISPVQLKINFFDTGKRKFVENLILEKIK